jgi:eukaryotic-like serine/threonine-protein kinase
MPLASGTRLGPYEIQSAIGAGGMGEVYKARDTRLDRTVAIKILPPDVSCDPDRRARFEREAKTIAGLNHPHICTLHDVGDHQGAMFLVMEHLAGETLAQRLEKGRLPLDQALTIANEIADALTAAHRQGVIHRDLKPGNVMLTKSGGVRQGSPQAKLLDFGLAKLAGHGEQAAAASLASVPTQTRPLTSEGAIVGTLQYMAPEQVEGKPADARTDLWALGAILYEMLTGTRAFDGASAASLIGNIMNAEPPALSTLLPLTPPSVDRLVRRCLAKAPDDRWDSAHDVADELRWIGGRTDASPAAPTAGRWLPRVIVAAPLMLVLAGGGGFLAARRLAPATAGVPASRLHIWLGDANLTLLDGGVAVSPNGQTIVFQARASDGIRLYARRLDDWIPRVLGGTEGASDPFFSPDGEWVAFRAARGGFDKVPLSGGPTQRIWRAPSAQSWTTGAVWSADDQVIFGRWPETGVWSVPAGGGELRALYRTSAEGEWCLWPDVLPDGKTVLFTVWRAGRMSIAAKSPSTDAVQTLVDSAAGAKYLPTGHLTYESDGKLFAMPFNPATLTKGQPRAVIPDIGQTRFGGSWRQSNRGRPYDVSATGTLAYGMGVTSPSRLVWRDRSGRTTPTKLPPDAYNMPVLSPDGTRVVDTIYDGAARSLRTGRVDGDSMRALTSGPDDCFSLVSWDDSVYFTRNNGGRYDIYRVALDGREEPQLVVSSPESKRATSHTRDGTLLYNQRDAAGGMDIWRRKDGVSQALIATPRSERDAHLSPDRHWLAYTSLESGRPQIWLRSYPAGSPEQISLDGGVGAVWGGDGREIFYQGPSGVMAAKVANGRRVGTPTMLFSHASEYRDWDVTADGNRFLVVEAGEPTKGTALVSVVTHWFEELRSKVPVPR